MFTYNFFDQNSLTFFRNELKVLTSLPDEDKETGMVAIFLLNLSNKNAELWTLGCEYFLVTISMLLKAAEEEFGRKFIDDIFYHPQPSDQLLNKYNNMSQEEKVKEINSLFIFLLKKAEFLMNIDASAFLSITYVLDIFCLFEKTGMISYEKPVSREQMN